MQAAPMIRSGQMSCQSEPSDAPSRMAARIPSSAYVAGEIVDPAEIAEAVPA